MGKFAASVAVIAAVLSTTGAEAPRGSDGQMKIMFWQAPSTQNPYLSGGSKEVESSSLVLEPLAGFDDRGNIFPRLAESIPTVANGGVAEDLRSITWKLKEGLLWSDGSPVTAADAVFTWRYCTHPQGGCAQTSQFEGVDSVEALDDRTIRIDFIEPKPFPYMALVGARSPLIQEAQFEDCIGARAPECTEANFHPVGTGPFMVREFRANDTVIYEANPNYRLAGKPAFATVVLKGGGDAAAAARAVLETGEFDYAWNLQVEPEILARMEKTGEGQIIRAFGASVERLYLNQTNPDPSLPPDRRSVWMAGRNQHPFLTDRRVLRAMSMAIDRGLIAELGYGAAARPTCNILPAPAIYVSTRNDSCLEQDIEGAKALLEEAGWSDSDGDGVRDKDGERLDVLFQTSTNSVRQATQAMIKQWWEEIGIETELRSISGSVFFGGDPASPDTYQKFYADVQMFTHNFTGVDPEAYMAGWRCDEIPGPESQWQGINVQRYCDPEYDRLSEEMARTGEIGRRAEIAREMNDMLVGSWTIHPLVHRASVSAHSSTLGGVRMSDWDSEIWNIQDWHRVETQ